jgi:hypothetical protein
MYCGEERKEEEEEEKEEKQKQRQKQNNKPIDSSPPRVILEPPGFVVRLIIGCGCGCGCLCGTILPAVALRSRLGASLVNKKSGTRLNGPPMLNLGLGVGEDITVPQLRRHVKDGTVI